MSNSPRDVERTYATSQVVAKLRRLADALETGKPFRIQIAGQRIRVPAHAQLSVEHERDEEGEEIELQLKWPAARSPSSDVDDEPAIDL